MKKISSNHILTSFDLDYATGFKDRKNQHNLTKNQNLLKNATLGVEKYELLHILYSKGYGKVYLDISDTVKNRYFNKMFNYLRDVDLADKKDLLDILPSLDENVVKTSLEKLILYFQDLEEYEKCAIIKKVSDILIK